MLSAFLALPATVGGQVVPLPDLIRPHRMAVRGDRLYVLEMNSRVVSFALPEGRKIGTFGRPGSGPGEFPMLPGNIRIAGDRVFVGNEHQGCFFSLDGRFISQHRPPTTGVLQPLGDGFFFSSMTFSREKREARDRLLILGPDMKCRAVVDEQEKTRDPGNGLMVMVSGHQVRFVSKGPVDLSPQAGPWMVGDGSRLLVARALGSEVEGRLYDAQGKMEGRFTLHIPPLRVDERMRKRLLEERKRMYDDFSPQYPDWEKAFDKLTFTTPEFLPPIQFLILRGEQVLVFTYVQEEGKTEVLLFDVQGRPIRRSLVFSGNRWLMDVDSGRLCRLVDNEERDQWELQIDPL